MTVTLTAPVSREAKSTQMLNDTPMSGNSPPKIKFLRARCQRSPLLPERGGRRDAVEHDGNQSEAARGIGEGRGNAGRFPMPAPEISS